MFLAIAFTANRRTIILRVRLVLLVEALLCLQVVVLATVRLSRQPLVTRLLSAHRMLLQRITTQAPRSVPHMVRRAALLLRSTRTQAAALVIQR